MTASDSVSFELPESRVDALGDVVVDGGGVGCVGFV